MNFLSKHVWYDWFGYNQKLFQFINHMYASPAYDSAVLFLAHVFDADNYPYFMLVLALYAGLSDLYLRIANKRRRGYLTAWVGALSVLAVGFVAMALAVKSLKSYFDMPRPYIVFPKGDVRLLEGAIQTGSDYHSFPSGHAAFITLLVAGLWPVLSRDMRTLGVILGIAVCLSRLAAGVHFPMDVIGAYVVTLLIVLIVREFVYWLLETLFGW